MAAAPADPAVAGADAAPLQPPGLLAGPDGPQQNGAGLQSPRQCGEALGREVAASAAAPTAEAGAGEAAAASGGGGSAAASGGDEGLEVGLRAGGAAEPPTPACKHPRPAAAGPDSPEAAPKPEPRSSPGGSPPLLAPRAPGAALPEARGAGTGAEAAPGGSTSAGSLVAAADTPCLAAAHLVRGAVPARDPRFVALRAAAGPAGAGPAAVADQVGQLEALQGFAGTPQGRAEGAAHQAAGGLGASSLEPLDTLGVAPVQDQAGTGAPGIPCARAGALTMLPAPAQAPAGLGAEAAVPAGLLCAAAPDDAAGDPTGAHPPPRAGEAAEAAPACALAQAAGAAGEAGADGARGDAAGRGAEAGTATALGGTAAAADVRREVSARPQGQGLEGLSMDDFQFMVSTQARGARIMVEERPSCMRLTSFSHAGHV